MANNENMYDIWASQGIIPKDAPQDYLDFLDYRTSNNSNITYNQYKLRNNKTTKNYGIVNWTPREDKLTVPNHNDSDPLVQYFRGWKYNITHPNDANWAPQYTYPAAAVIVGSGNLLKSLARTSVGKQALSSLGKGLFNAGTKTAKLINTVGKGVTPSTYIKGTKGVVADALAASFGGAATTSNFIQNPTLENGIFAAANLFPMTKAFRPVLNESNNIRGAVHKTIQFKSPFNTNINAFVPATAVEMVDVGKKVQDYSNIVGPLIYDMIDKKANSEKYFDEQLRNVQSDSEQSFDEELRNVQNESQQSNQQTVYRDFYDVDSDVFDIDDKTFNDEVETLFKEKGFTRDAKGFTDFLKYLLETDYDDADNSTEAKLARAVKKNLGFKTQSLDPSIQDNNFMIYESAEKAEK